MHPPDPLDRVGAGAVLGDRWERVGDVVALLQVAAVLAIVSAAHDLLPGVPGRVAREALADRHPASKTADRTALRPATAVKPFDEEDIVNRFVETATER